MAATSSRRTSLRSTSTAGGFSSSSSTAFAYSSSSFASRSSTLFSGGGGLQHHRSTSPNRVNMYGTTPSASSVRFSLDRPTSPSRSISAVNSPRGQQLVRKPSTTPKRTCMCSPTNHPGSFRCSLHKNCNSNRQSVSSPNTRLNARRSAMTNSIVRICGVEGDLVKRALSALIRPSSHQQKRRASFQPRRSRLSVMSNSDES
ncbi:serine-rich protein-related [Euphorbia peplus]|nr:serine-rich protein-related [Euphorbia peplus]